jgi:hypothetical protein
MVIRMSQHSSGIDMLAASVLLDRCACGNVDVTSVLEGHAELLLIQCMWYAPTGLKARNCCAHITAVNARPPSMFARESW